MSVDIWGPCVKHYFDLALGGGQVKASCFSALVEGDKKEYRAAEGSVKASQEDPGGQLTLVLEGSLWTPTGMGNASFWPMDVRIAHDAQAGKTLTTVSLPKLNERREVDDPGIMSSNTYVQWFWPPDPGGSVMISLFHDDPWGDLLRRFGLTKFTG